MKLVFILAYFMSMFVAPANDTWIKTGVVDNFTYLEEYEFAEQMLPLRTASGYSSMTMLLIEVVT